MAVAPLDADGVVADELDAEGFDIARHGGRWTALARHLAKPRRGGVLSESRVGSIGASRRIDAARAGTVESKKFRGIDALVPILPFHLDVKEIRSADLNRNGRHRVRHYRRFTGRS